MFPLKVCHPVLNSLAVSLPYAHCSQVKKRSCHQGKNFISTTPLPQSRLICSISGRALDENNQPMMLPNGKPIASSCWSLLYLKWVLKVSHCIEEWFIPEITRLCLWRASTDEPSGPERRQSNMSEVESFRVLIHEFCSIFPTFFHGHFTGPRKSTALQMPRKCISCKKLNLKCVIKLGDLHL